MHEQDKIYKNFIWQHDANLSPFKWEKDFIAERSIVPKTINDHSKLAQQSLK